MTTALLTTHWQKIRGECRCYWGKLTDDDLERIGGCYDKFVAALRARYGFAQLQAEDELERFLFGYSDAPHGREAGMLVDARA